MSSVPLFCPSCGASAVRDDLYCGSCGYALGPIDSSEAMEVKTAGATHPLIPPTALDETKTRSSTTAGTQPGTPIPASALVGEAAPNATYLGQRLLYDKVPEGSFDPVTSWPFLRGVLLRFFLFFIVDIVKGILSFFVIAIFSWLAGDSGRNLAIFLSFVTEFVYWGVFWFRATPVCLSDWKFCLDGKRNVERTVFEHVVWAFQQRKTPVDGLQVRRLNLPNRGQRDYLEVRQGIFRGYISCFAYGNDLFVGWTFWLYLSPARLVGMFFMRLWHSVTFRASDLYVTLSYDGAKALREAIHNAARQGIDVAAGTLAPQGRGIVGQRVGVDIVNTQGSRLAPLP